MSKRDLYIKSCASGSISNSDGSYTASVPSGGSLTLPDETINITDQDGNVLDSITFPVYTDPNIDISTLCPDWKRPLDWLPMPTVTSAQQTFVGLHAVIENSDNYCAFRFTTSTGQYQVDWGDGTVDLVNSNVNAEHQYDFATYDTGNTTLTSRGYKQAMITVTPVSGNLLTCNFQQRFETVPAQNQAYSTGFLDCILSMPNANTGASIVFGGTTVRHTFVERFDIKTIGACTNLQSLFQNAYSLQFIPLFDTSGVFTLTSMFNGCSSLQFIPLFDTINVQAMNTMFINCNSIRSIPLLNTINVSNMASMFNGCNSLQSIPLLNTIHVTNMSVMLNGCQSLNSIPALSTAAINTDFGAFFANGANSLNRCQMVFQRTVSFQNCQLSRDSIEEILTNLAPRPTTSAEITLTENWGLGTPITRTATITDGSTTISISDTTGLLPGMQVTGTGSPLTTPVSVTFQDAGDTVTLTAHGLEDDDEVSFATITTTTGLVENTIYYIINKTTDTFQLSSTVGGLALPLTNNGTGTMRHRTEIVSIVTDTSVTMSRPMRATGSQTLTFRELKTGTGLLKNWVVVG